MKNTQTTSRLVEAAAKHAGKLLEYAKDPSGRSPLFANAVDAETSVPAAFDPDHVNKEALLASPASQQHFLKLLVGLTRLTGDDSYAEKADSVIRFMLREQTDSSGLIYWGGHTAFNLENQSIEYAGDKSKVHELKFHYPDYELMWNADAEGTKRYIEAIWNAHILDWASLDFNRHGPYETKRGPVWQHAYKGDDVFFWGKGLTFVNAGSDLYFAAAMLAKLSGDRLPLEWSKRMAHRYVETRQPDIGISGYQFSQSANSWCDGPSVRGDRAQYQIAPLVPAGHLVYEGTLFKPRPVVQRCQLEIGERLGDDGEAFIRWSCEEMTAWGTKAYRKSDNSFIPMLTDGYVIEGLTLDRNGYFGRKGTVFQAIPANSDFFWMYASGFRHSGNEFLWEMARSIALGIGAGDIGQYGGNERSWRPKAERCDYRLIYGLLELYQATGSEEFLDFSVQTAETLLQHVYADGAFVSNGRILTDDPLPLTLLHLSSILRQETAAVPRAWK